jgi:hypothetical protein
VDFRNQGHAVKITDQEGRKTTGGVDAHTPGLGHEAPGFTGFTFAAAIRQDHDDWGNGGGLLVVIGQAEGGAAGAANNVVARRQSQHHRLGALDERVVGRVHPDIADTNVRVDINRAAQLGIICKATTMFLNPPVQAAQSGART